MRTIRWGIIGCGDVTEVKSGPALQRAEGSELVAVMRRTGELARDYAARHGVPRWYDDADALVADPEVDAVYVATPPSSHLEHALRAARAGKPVYVEKPMALDHAECVRMIDGCRAAGVPLFVAYYRRALPRFLEIKRLLDTGAIGAPRTVTVTLTRPASAAERDGAALPWRVRPEIAGGGHFVDLAAHTLDFLDFALGPVTAAWGVASNLAGRYPAEDTVSGAWRHASGVHGTGSWCFDAFAPRDEVAIEGTDGILRFSTFGTDPIALTTAAGTTETQIEHPPHIQQPMIQAIVRALNGDGESPSTGDTAARTSWVMDRLLRR